MTTPLRIMLVDDDKDQLMVLTALFQRAGFDVTQVENAREGIEMLKHESVDAVISDLAMPQMTGIDFGSQIRQIPGKGQLPIFFLTAGQVPGEEERGGFPEEIFFTKQRIQQTLVPAVRNKLGV